MYLFELGEVDQRIADELVDRRARDERQSSEQHQQCREDPDEHRRPATANRSI